MTSDDWRILNAAKYNEFQRSVIERKGGRNQVTFLRAMQKKESFLAYMDMIPTEGSQSYPTPNWKFTEREFRNPPVCTEEKIYDHWKDLSPAVASCPGFWAQATIDLVREGCIQQTNLSGKSKAPGDRQIDNALQEMCVLSIDSCVRDILRRMSGIQYARGNRSVFSDCTLARAWWRERLVRQVSHETGLAPREIGVALRDSKAHWEALVTAIVSRGTVFGNRAVQNAFVANLASLWTADPSQDRSKLRASLIKDACQSVCMVGASIELPVLDLDDIHALMRNLMVKLSGNACRS